MLDTLSPLTVTGGRRTSPDYGNLLVCRGCMQRLKVREYQVCPICIRPAHEACLLRATHQGIRGETSEARRGCLRCQKDDVSAGFLGADPIEREED